MEKLLADVPEATRNVPDGVVMVPTGPYPPQPGDNRLIPEFFYREAIPPPEVLQPPRPVAPLPQPEAPPVPGA
jgi:hypothetical protein